MQASCSAHVLSICCQFLLHSLYSSLLFFWNAKFLPVYDAFNSFSYPGFVIREHLVSRLISLDESTKTSQSVQSLKVLNSITRPLFDSLSHSRFPLHQRPIFGDKFNNVMVRSSQRRERHRGIGVFNICVALVKYTIFPCKIFPCWK